MRSLGWAVMETAKSYRFNGVHLIGLSGCGWSTAARGLPHRAYKVCRLPITSLESSPGIMQGITCFGQYLINGALIQSATQGIQIGYEGG